MYESSILLLICIDRFGLFVKTLALNYYKILVKIDPDLMGGIPVEVSICHGDTSLLQERINSI